MSITVYVGRAIDCGCEISEAEWSAYLALVRAEVASVYNCAESAVDVEPGDVSGLSARMGGFVDGVPDHEALREIANDVWDAGGFWVQP